MSGGRTEEGRYKRDEETEETDVNEEAIRFVFAAVLTRFRKPNLNKM